MTSGNSAILSGTIAAEVAGSVGIIVPLGENGLEVDPYYGQVPTTVYLGGGAGGAYATGGIGFTGSICSANYSYLLPWNW